MTYQSPSGGRSSKRPQQVSTGSSYHVPVLASEAVEHLITDKNGTYVDATLGGGGHSAVLVRELGERGRLFGIDRDTSALAAARERFADLQDRAPVLIHGSFAHIADLLESEGVNSIDGLLLDLGVSSKQIDEPLRGFSFDRDGPLDMRMDREAAVDAGMIINTSSVDDLVSLLRRYGEEPKAVRIARAIAEARPLDSTAALAAVVRGVVPYRETAKTLARVFQAFRIAVNEEMAELETVLWSSVDLIHPGGRLVVISYHSLEDRRVKRFMRYGNLEGIARRDIYGNVQTPWVELTRKPIAPSPEECRSNPRARSARLRVAERIPDTIAEK